MLDHEHGSPAFPQPWANAPSLEVWQGELHERLQMDDKPNPSLTRRTPFLERADHLGGFKGVSQACLRNPQNPDVSKFVSRLAGDTRGCPS